VLPLGVGLVEKLELRDFQKQDVLFLRKHNYRVLVANAPGTGKTIECLAAIALDRVKLCPVIIVAPSSVLWNWHRETRKWCKWAKIHVISDKSTPLPKERKHIYITSWTLMADRVMEIISKKPRLLIADEAHMAKNIDALRTRALYALSTRCRHLLLLTGTPLINSKQELETLKMFFGIDNPPMIRRLLNDVAPDIPEKTRATLPVYLPPKVAMEYRRAVEDFENWLNATLRLKMDDGQAEAAARRSMAAEALVKVGYLRRIVGRGKVNAAVDWAARAVRLGEPVVLFAEHSAVIKRMMLQMKKQRLAYVVIVGSTPKAQRQQMIDKFQNGEVPIFIGSKAAATGITLTRARHLCFVERFWTSAEEEQAEDRIRRISQPYPTKIWFLHAHGTIDDRVAQVIERKRRVIREAIGSEDIAETPEKTVISIINSWSEHANAKVYKGDAMLGLVRSLPPLPKPKNTYQVIFKGPRWNKAAVKAWGKMNNYNFHSVVFDGRVWRGLVHQASLFMDGKYKIFAVSKDIKILLGKRRKKIRRRMMRRRSRGLLRNGGGR
jgi:SNF2 family DNA or RNA helicase